MNKDHLMKEVVIRTARSGGPGGQHVNKTETKVTIFFNIPDSNALSHTEKERLFLKLAPKLTKDGTLIISSSASRSQHDNKAHVFELLINTLYAALRRQKKRRPTRLSKAKKAKRADLKKRHSEKKNRRKPIDY